MCLEKLLLAKHSNMHGIVYVKAANFCLQSANKNVVLVVNVVHVLFPPVAILIFNRFECVISQMKEKKKKLTKNV